MKKILCVTIMLISMAILQVMLYAHGGYGVKTACKKEFKDTEIMVMAKMAFLKKKMSSVPMNMPQREDR